MIEQLEKLAEGTFINIALFRNIIHEGISVCVRDGITDFSIFYNNMIGTSQVSIVRRSCLLLGWSVNQDLCVIPISTPGVEIGIVRLLHPLGVMRLMSSVNRGVV